MALSDLILHMRFLLFTPLLFEFTLTHILSFFASSVKYSRKFYCFLFPQSIILQNTTAAPVLTAVARIPAPTIAAGFTLPY